MPKGGPSSKGFVQRLAAYRWQRLSARWRHHIFMRVPSSAVLLSSAFTVRSPSKLMMTRAMKVLVKCQMTRRVFAPFCCRP